MKMYSLFSRFPMFPMEVPNSSKHQMNCQADDVSDGYHTMEELYTHRYHLYLALVKIYDNYVTPIDCHVKCWKSKLHDDGTMFDDSFVLGMTVTKPPFDIRDEPEKFYITYHLPMKYWHLANVVELYKAPPYDGHTPDHVLERLLRL